VTGTFLLVGVDRSTDTILGLELNRRGFPFHGENTLSSTQPSRYPRVSASRTQGVWNVVFSGPNFGALSRLTATSFSSSGGAEGAFDSLCPGAAPRGWRCWNGDWIPPDTLLIGRVPPPPPLPEPLSSSCPGAPPVAGWVCVNGSWIPPEPL
jgi:hypothetical protein